MNRSLLIIFLSLLQLVISAQVLTTSTLPIIIVDTEGQTILDEPKINSTMKIIYKSEGVNDINQDSAHFEGSIGIELRGQSSLALFPKKGYGVEVRDSLGEDLDASILDMPEESDWVIHSPYSDKSLIRNALSYTWAGRIMPYAPRVKMAELVINNNYQGIVLWTEKIKRDKNRVDVNKLKDDENEGDDLTGGYIIKFDKGDAIEVGWISPYEPIPGRNQDTRFLFNYPKYDDITPEQRNYIKGYVTEFEHVLMSDDFKDPINGYRKYIDVQSFIQIMIINELTRNVDGYRLSTYMYKDKDSNGGKLHMGPVWDYNLALGNADYCSGSSDSGWAYDFNNVCPQDFWVNHVWWKRLLEDPAFTQELIASWQSLRSTIFSDENLNADIDSLTTVLGGAIERNFQRWPVLGNYVWPNNFVGATYQSEIDYLKRWIENRTAWLDDNFKLLTTATKNINLTPRSLVYPNPSLEDVTIDMTDMITTPDYIEVYNHMSQLIYSSPIKESQIELSLTASSDQSIMYYRLFKDGSPIETQDFQIIRQR